MELKDLAFSAFQAATSGALSMQSIGIVVALLSVVAGLRLLLAPRVPFFGTTLGLLVLNVACSGLAAAVTAMCGGAGFTFALLGASLLMSFKAAGGWAVLEPLVFPLILKIPFFANHFPPKSAVVVGALVAPVKPTTLEDIVNK